MLFGDAKDSVDEADRGRQGRPRKPTRVDAITTEAELREVIGFSHAVVQSKISDSAQRSHPPVHRALAVHAASRHPRTDGTCDVSPRGDPAGFVRILDERTLLVPERPGNRLADSLRNVLANPHVGLLFLVPGVGDTLRVNGRAIAHHRRRAARALSRSRGRRRSSGS